MAFIKDISKLANGLSLVAKEAVNRQLRNDGVNLQSLLKKTLLSATDLTGLTKGKVRQLDKEINSNSNADPNSNKQSVVYFTDANSISTTSTSESEVVERDLAALNQVSSAAQVLEHVESPPQATETSCEVDPLSLSNDSIPSESKDAESVVTVTPQPFTKRQRKPRERKVPTTSFSRALGFAGLGAGLAWGTLQESAKRIVFGAPSLEGKQSAISPYLSEKNAERLALALCRMRGAALKLGQMLSIQDESLVPAPILAALDIVRQGADVMPRSQLNQVLSSELGHDWPLKLKSFDYEPIAAASIGQVHRAFTKDGMEVAMKIQYPGVADSIERDIDNVKLLLSYTNLIPEKLYIDNAMKVAKEELSRECDYELEAKNQKRFGVLLSGTKGFYVPVVIDDLSSKRVLTSELVAGVPIDKVALMGQETRNYVGRKLLELTLKELFVFRFMQTDPNWSNFLYDESEKVINLIDFGAARDYPKNFVDDYLRMVFACANNEREAVIELSQRLGFMTGEESEVMVDAHVQAGFVVGLPFSKHGGYDFGSSNITQSISNLGATMLRHRLTPPPEEAYSLHREALGSNSFPPPYLAPNVESNATHSGINYASGASGILDATGTLFIGRVPLTQQINNFEETRRYIVNAMGEANANIFLKKAMFSLTIGSNDVLNYFQPSIPFLTHQKVSPTTFQDLLLSNLSINLQRLHRLGARKFVVVGVGPLGCIPFVRATRFSKKCSVEVNTLIRGYNKKLKAELHRLNKDMGPEAMFTYANSYDIFREIILNYKQHGFENGDAPCCGGYFPPFLCYKGNNRSSVMCDDRGKYVFWDAYHPTEAANLIVAQNLLDGDTALISPINIRQLHRYGG